MITLWMLTGCGWYGGADQSVRSIPTEPVVDLQGEGPIKTTMVWSELAEMFPEQPGIARPLRDLRPGARAADARQRLQEASKEGVTVFESELAGHPTLSSVLRHGHTDVPVTLVLNKAGTVLESVDFDIDWPSASAVLYERWGKPKNDAPLVDGKPLSTWDAAGWRVELHRLPEGKGIVHFGAAGS